MNKLLLAVVGVALVGGIVFIVMNKTPAAPIAGESPVPVQEPAPTPVPVATSAPQQTTPEPVKPPVKTGITSAEVATHASASDCWAIVNGAVYNLTSWITKHPGGKQAILGMCGKDGSSAFEGKHAGEPKPEQMLASFKIGALAQ